MLAQQLRALSQANRLHLLNLLREPKTIGNLIIAPGPGRAGGRPERPITRQSVLEHLHKLEEVGLVKSRPAGKERSTQLEYVTVRTQLFAMMESLREVTETQPIVTDPSQTQAASPWSTYRDTGTGPQLIVVHGAEPGKVFPLRPDARTTGRGWILGRKTQCHVCLDYDPYASSENAEILRKDDGGFRLLDLRTARNGTWLNWKRLPLGAEAPLQAGDVIGIGRSLLVFRTG